MALDISITSQTSNLEQNQFLNHPVILLLKGMKEPFVSHSTLDSFIDLLKANTNSKFFSFFHYSKYTGFLKRYTDYQLFNNQNLPSDKRFNALMNALSTADDSRKLFLRNLSRAAFINLYVNEAPIQINQLNFYKGLSSEEWSEKFSLSRVLQKVDDSSGWVFKEKCVQLYLSACFQADKCLEALLKNNGKFFSSKKLKNTLKNLPTTKDLWLLTLTLASKHPKLIDHYDSLIMEFYQIAKCSTITALGNDLTSHYKKMDTKFSKKEHMEEIVTESEAMLSQLLIQLVYESSDENNLSSRMDFYLSNQMIDCSLLSQSPNNIMYCLGAIGYFISKSTSIYGLQLPSMGINISNIHSLILPICSVDNNSLQLLDLSENDLGGKVSDWLFKLLLKLQLTHLNLSTCKLATRGISLVAQSFACMPLVYLNLSSNLIESQGAKSLMKNLCYMPFLEVLDLSGNPIKQASTKLLECLKKTTRLKELYMNNNLIGDEGAISLASLVGCHEQITRVEVAGNMISSKGADAISEKLGTSKSIRFLDLSANQITFNSVIKLKQVCREMPDLEVVTCDQSSRKPLNMSMLNKRLKQQMLEQLHLCRMQKQHEQHQKEIRIGCLDDILDSKYEKNDRSYSTTVLKDFLDDKEKIESRKKEKSYDGILRQTPGRPVETQGSMTTSPMTDKQSMTSKETSHDEVVQKVKSKDLMEQSDMALKDDSVDDNARPSEDCVDHNNSPKPTIEGLLNFQLSIAVSKVVGGQMKAKVFTGDKEKFFEKRIQELEEREKLEEQRKKRENLDIKEQQEKLKKNQKISWETQEEQQPPTEVYQESSESSKTTFKSPKNTRERITAGVPWVNPLLSSREKSPISSAGKPSVFNSSPSQNTTPKAAPRMRSRMRRFFRKSFKGKSNEDRDEELTHLNEEKVASSNVLLENNKSDLSLKETKATKSVIDAEDKTKNLITNPEEKNIEEHQKDYIKIDRGKSEKMGLKETISSSFLKRFNSHKSVVNSSAKVETKIEADNRKPRDLDYKEQLYQQAKTNEINISEISGNALVKPFNNKQPVTSSSFNKAAGDDDVIPSSDFQPQNLDKTPIMEQKSSSAHLQSICQQQETLDKLELCIEQSPQRFSPFFAALKSNDSSSRVVAGNVTPRPYLPSK